MRLLLGLAMTIVLFANSCKSRDFGESATSDTGVRSTQAESTPRCPDRFHLFSDGGPWRCESDEIRRINPPCPEGFGYALPTKSCQPVGQNDDARQASAPQCKDGFHLFSDGGPWRCESDEMRRINPPCPEGFGYALPTKSCQPVGQNDGSQGDLVRSCQPRFHLIFDAGHWKCESDELRRINPPCQQGFGYVLESRSCQPIGRKD